MTGAATDGAVSPIPPSGGRWAPWHSPRWCSCWACSSSIACPSTCCRSIDYPQIRVTVNYPGVAPEVMEQQVTRVLEQQPRRHGEPGHHRQPRLPGAHQRQPDLRVRHQPGPGAAGRRAPAGAGAHPAAAGHRAAAPLQVRPGPGPVWQAGFSSSVRSEAEVRDWVENQLAPQLIAIHGVSGRGGRRRHGARDRGDRGSGTAAFLRPLACRCDGSTGGGERGYRRRLGHLRPPSTSWPRPTACSPRWRRSATCC
jgi:hypothetical protein